MLFIVILEGRMTRLRGSVLCFCFLINACGTEGETSAPPPDIAPNPTYQREIRPAIEAHCLDCHARGGVAGLPLDSWASVSALREGIVSAVDSGHMPPWPASAECRALRDSRALSQQVRKTFAGWRRDGYPEGDEADYATPARAIESGDVTRPTKVLSTGGYLPAPNIDSGRCFILTALDSDTYVTAIQVTPGQTSEVHHAHLERVDALTLSALMLLDRQSAAPGYPCEANPSLASDNLFTYLPGDSKTVFPEGDALFIEGKGALILKIHYNTYQSSLPPVEDETTVALWTLPPGAAPEHIVYRSAALANLHIPAGAKHVVASATTSMSMVSRVGGYFGYGGVFLPGELIGVSAHAHQLATSVASSLERKDGSTECLLDVPRWDFHWQLNYQFEEPLRYSESDSLHVECDYDNSAEHQPIVSGVQQAPRDVNWGDRTIDEMCLHMLWLRFDAPAFLRAWRATH